ncbi:hypothetical protein EYY60_01840 [Flavobacterium zhairuonense]|uniref:hypothetical protein n=1 Tax=Flavobacterium zhairuonense TaxID=2493631 RepID=UPI001051497C|nr:hypothetical protein [Flavobacterium zhairuonense]KAF2515886.1 hypothetical protein EYY60_01840 [Flavobacterium zhairuonense]
MKRFEFLDLLQRRVNSILFRLSLLCYALIIILTNKNIFEKWVYYVVLPLYILVYIKFIRLSFVRLLNDFAFILIVLWGKSPYDIYNYTFLFLPIINAINFSGKKKSLLLYFLTVFEFFLLHSFSTSDSEIKNLKAIKVLFPVFFLGIINWYTHLRMKIKVFREELIEVVDTFYLNKEHIKKPHKIYKKFIDVIHSNINHVLIKEMYCFCINKASAEKIIIVNGTSFVWNYKFKEDDFINRLRKYRTLTDETVIIDENNINKNLIIYTIVDNNEYFYLFSLNKKIPFYYSLIGFFRTIEPSLSKMSKILLSEKKLQEIKDEEIEKLSQKTQYVNRANNMMHYIRNRLSPFSNLSMMLDNQSKIPAEKIEAFQKLLIEQNERSKIELRNITKRADDMLEKSKNPFFYKTLSDVSIEKTFTILRRNFLSYFPDEEIEVGVKLSSQKRTVKLNEEGFEIFITDWLNNIKKYKNKIIRCIFIEENNNLCISFFNDHNQTKEQIANLLQDLKSDDRNEIIKRTTYGLFIIKSTLDDMDIKYSISHQNGIIEFKIELKINKDESSDIRK